MNYTEKDFARCRFNPLKKNLLTSYPELDSISSEANVSEQVMAYIIAAYDPESPIVKRNKDLKQRKMVCCELAGIKDKQVIESLIDLTDLNVVSAIDLFLKNHIKSMLWYMISSNEQTFFEYGKRLIQPIKESEAKEKDLISAISAKSKLSEDMGIIYDRIKKGYAELYDDEKLEEKVTSGFKPEAYATRV